MRMHLIAAFIVASVSGIGVLAYQSTAASAAPEYDKERLYDVLTWKEFLSERGGDATRDEYLRATAPHTPATQHIAAHAYGRALYEEFGVAGLRFCGLEYTGGCIHEMIAQDFLDEEDPLSSASRCDGYELPFACEHALGHGFMAYYGYTEDGLRSALAQCESSGIASFAHGCTYGVIMEYYFRNLQGNLVRDANDPNAYAFCDSLDGMARQSCFYNISTLWFNVDKYATDDPERPYFMIADRCLAIPDKGRDRIDCANGVGRSIGSLGTIPNERRVEMCTDVFAADPMYAGSCMNTISQFRQLFGE